jgi:DNA polymerase-3 subunit gamma/tau
MLRPMAAARDPHDDGSYQVVARRFRPTTFQELVGQDDVLHSLRAALAQKTVPHAFLFSGSRGVGKTTSARILARCLNCDKGPTPEPCGVCKACVAILDGSSPDVIEIDAASNNGVDDVRRLCEMVGYATMGLRYRVVILDEAHMMSKAAFNAFLKTLEEPPPGVVFVLATTELHMVPETIRSRCQVLLFKRVGEPDLVRRLRKIADKEAVPIPDDVLAEIAASVRGGVRDAETALERVLPLAREMGAKFDLAAFRTLVARVGTDATVGVVEALLGGDAKAGLHFARDLQRTGADEREVLGEIVEVLRWLLLLRVDGADTGLVPVSGSLRDRLQTLATAVEPHRLDAMLAAALRGRERLRDVDDRGVVFEVTMVRMAEAGALPTLADLLAEVRAGGGVRAVASSGDGPASPPTRPTFGRGAVPASGMPTPTANVAAAAPVAPPGGDLRGRVLAALKDRQLLQATIERCRFDGPDANGGLVVTMTSDQKMYRDRLQSAGVQADLQKVIHDAAGRPLRIEWRIPTAAADASPRPKPAAAADPGPTTKAVMAAFKGRVVQVNPEDRARLDSPAAGSEPPRRDDEGAPVDEQPPLPD